MNDKQGYRLLDSGESRKLEAFGEITLIRPEDRATWEASLSRADWQLADFEYLTGQGWVARSNKPMPYMWTINISGYDIQCEVGESKQVGVFPENLPHWTWIENQCKKRETPRVLNLFGYTGMASLAAARGGAEVAHVDASRRALRLGRRTQELSGLSQAVVRWLHDDVLEFVRKEGRRGRSYSGIILDPPAYGMGPRKQRWEFEKYVSALMGECTRIFEANEGFAVLTAYSLRRPPEYLRPILAELVGVSSGIEIGTLTINELSKNRVLDMSIYAKWSGL